MEDVIVDNDYMLTLTDVIYDQKKLQKWYLEIKKHAVDTNIFKFQSDDIQTGIDKSEVWNGRLLSNITLLYSNGFQKSYADYVEVQELYNLFNFKNFARTGKLCANNDVNLMISDPYFNFYPHIDNINKDIEDTRRCVLMFPILPDDGGVGLDIYTKSIFPHGIPPHNDRHHLGCYKYSTKYPTLTNAEVPHGIRNDNRFRVILQIDVYEPFISCKQRIKDGTFYKS